MIAIGRDGETILILGRNAGGIVSLECSEEEARGALRQLSALLAPESKGWIPPSIPVGDNPWPASARPPAPIGAPPVGFIDPTAEARARDAAELAKNADAEVAANANASAAQKAKIAAREARLNSLGLGSVTGPIDE